MPTASKKRRLGAGERIRVLVVDDSVVIRRLVTHALAENPLIEVIGSAANGKLALDRISILRPDVLTLDIEMPEMDGLETLRHLKRSHPGIRVVMFSTLTEHGASATMQALSLGADDYVAKASNAGSLDQSMERLRSELVPKIQQFFLLDEGIKPQAAAPPAPVPLRCPPPSVKPRIPPRVVAIGVSTGGPNALAVALPIFPKDFSLPVLVVQHMPPIFTKMLAERLDAAAHLHVEEARESSQVEPGKVLIAPGNFHMTVRQKDNNMVIALNQNPPEHSCRPSVDVLFRSVAQVYGGSAVAVVLTGMGHDGVAGAGLLRSEGAHIIAQDQESSVVWGMPGGVVKAQLAHDVLSLEQIVPKIVEQTR